MPRITWPLLHNRPVVRVVLALRDPQHDARDLLADTGAGSNSEVFELILREGDCLRYGVRSGSSVALSGAFDLDHLRAEIAEHLAAKGTGKDA